jgi:hypothetical protein
MKKLDKAAALEWFKAHKDQEIEIKWRGNMVRLRGRCTGVQSLDACSAEYEESQLGGLHEDVQIGFSFHDATLGVHLSLYPPQGKQPAAFVPLSIPYEQLELTIPKSGQEGKDSSGGKGEEPEFSPYELLH